MSKEEYTIGTLMVIFATLYALGSTDIYKEFGTALQWVANIGLMMSLTMVHLNEQKNKTESLPITSRNEFIKTLSLKYPDIPHYYTIRACELLENRLGISKERLHPDMRFSEISKLLPQALSGAVKKMLKVKYRPQCEALKFQKDTTVGDYIHTLFIHSVDPNQI